ncbi:unnamed protein product [Darwinula stevensoni]|uniref:tryptophan--tRNA ligase n=1 Tax=Darwinula stevensoni TaxID=69355 RepID=A0A7R8XCD1_9CRUS|nr:unnamed protein product [Darwinula stevensoni]CAG0887633.1 unnamed protein product [Darwinula stevensoni]
MIGTLHLGNYFGAIQQWVNLQNEGHDTFFSIVDLHSLTIPQTYSSRGEMYDRIMEVTACLLACGIDPSKSVLFQQSHVKEHVSLAWVLGCLTTLPRLGQLPQYKEKSATLKDIPLGLYTYPVLQSADILLYKAELVPVGSDQVQHVQLAQHLGRTFNTRFHSSLFPRPSSLILGLSFFHRTSHAFIYMVIEDEGGSRIRSLRCPEKKMSKSEADPKSRILLTDPPDLVREKVKKAVTDFISRLSYEPEKRAGVSNLLLLHSLVSGETIQDIVERVNSHGMDTGKYKGVVAEDIIGFLQPIQSRIRDYLNDPEYLRDTLKSGARKAESVARETWDQVTRVVGLSPS